MFHVLMTLIVIDLGFFVTTTWGGVLLESAESMRQHMTWGIVTAFLFLFTHCLVLFYLIGSGTDVKEALEEHPDLYEKHVPWTKSLKRRAFPWGSGAAFLTVVAALLGGHVHSNLLLRAPPEVAPEIRGVAGWWVHLAFVLIAFAVNVVAFRVELAVVRDNRRGIDEINAELALRERPEVRPLEA